MDTQLFMLPVRMDTTRFNTHTNTYSDTHMLNMLCVICNASPYYKSSYVWCICMDCHIIASPHTQCVVQLLGHEADFNKTSLNGGNPVYFACKSALNHTTYSTLFCYYLQYARRGLINVHVSYISHTGMGR